MVFLCSLWQFPVEITNTDISKLWYKKDSTFKTPRGTTLFFTAFQADDAKAQSAYSNRSAVSVCLSVVFLSFCHLPPCVLCPNGARLVSTSGCGSQVEILVYISIGAISPHALPNSPDDELRHPLGRPKFVFAFPIKQWPIEQNSIFIGIGKPWTAFRFGAALQ